MTIHLITNTETGELKCGANAFWRMIYEKTPDGSNNYDKPPIGKEKKISTRKFLAGVTEPEKVSCKRCLNTVKRPVIMKLTDNYVGKIFHAQWGYDMTINDYAKVIKQTASTLTLQICYTMTNGESYSGRGTGKAWAGDINQFYWECNGKENKI